MSTPLNPAAGTPATGSSATSEAARRQAEALEVSAWGEPFRFWQPRNLCFWVFVGLTALGAVNTRAYYAPRLGFYAEALAIAAVAIGLAGAAWWWWFRHVDRYERQPVPLIVAGFVWGAIPAIFALAFTVNTAFLGIYAKLFGQAWAYDWGAGATAPITEESIKLCGFLLLMGMAPRLIRTANDGLIIGAFIGLGFGLFEDFLYAAQGAATRFGSDAVGVAEYTTAARVGFSAVSHPLFSALVCSGFIYLVGTAAQPRRVGRGVGFIAAGMFIHFTWDSQGALSRGSDFGPYLVMLGSFIIAFTMLRLAFRSAEPREHQLVRDILAPEVENGTLTEAEVSTLLARKDYKAYRKAAPNRQAKRARKHLHQAVLDLAHDVAAARGTETEAVSYSRAEVGRLREQAELHPTTGES